MSNKLFMKDAEKARDAIMDSQKKHIENLYTQWAEDIAKKGKIYEMKSAPSYALKVKQSKELEKFLKESSHVIANEVDKSIKESIYLVSDSVVKSNANWLNHMGGQVKGSFLMFNSAAFSSVPDSIVRKLVTGQIYDSGWSLSKSIWGDNEDTLSKLYEIVAGGMAKNESIYDISKKLEAFVKPEAAKKWNLKTADGKRIYPKQVDYNAQRLARTLSQHAYQQSFVEVTKDNPLIIDYIWRSNGSRACPICISRDGQHFSKDSLPLDHPNGMCVMEPNIEKDYINRVANWVKNPDGTDPEFDKFAEKIGYIAPSKKMPKTLEEFKTALGPTKYKSSGSWFNHLDPDMQKAMKEFHAKSGMSWADIHAQFYDGGKGAIGATAKNAADVNYKFANNKIKSIFEKAGFPDPNDIPDVKTFLDKLVTDSDALMEFLHEYNAYSAKHPGIKLEDYYTKIFAKPKKVKVVPKVTGVEIDDEAYSLFKKLGLDNANVLKDLDDDWGIHDYIDNAFDELFYVKNKKPSDKELESIFKLIGYNGSTTDWIDNYDDIVDKLEAYLVDVKKSGKPFTVVAPQVDQKAIDSAKIIFDGAKTDLDSISNKVYSGIWKEDVTPADYLAKKSKINAKKKYYEDEIAKLSSDTYSKYSWVPQDLAKKKQLLADLEDFEKQGMLYSKAKDDYDKAKDAYYSLVGKPEKFSLNDYTNEAKKAAHRFTSAKEADKFHRPYLDSIWNEFDDNQKYSVWEYTQNSNPINKSLSGYHDDWSRSNFVGVGKADLGHEDSWRSFNTSTFSKKFGVDGHKDYKNVVKNLTNAIDKSELPESVYLVRGSDKGGFAGLLEGSNVSFNDAMKLLNGSDSNFNKLKTIVENQTFANHSFMSTGIAEGTGFSREVSYKIYAPAGTRGIYAEPASYYGNTISGEQLYKVGTKYSSIGSEAEVILQRGTEFRITNLSKDRYGDITVEMEIVNQPDYFNTGLEMTHNGGKTVYKK